MHRMVSTGTHDYQYQLWKQKMLRESLVVHRGRNYCINSGSRRYCAHHSKFPANHRQMLCILCCHISSMSIHCCNRFLMTTTYDSPSQRCTYVLGNLVPAIPESNLLACSGLLRPNSATKGVGFASPIPDAHHSKFPTNYRQRLCIHLSHIIKSNHCCNEFLMTTASLQQPIATLYVLGSLVPTISESNAQKEVHVYLGTSIDWTGNVFQHFFPCVAAMRPPATGMTTGAGSRYVCRPPRASTSCQVQEPAKRPGDTRT